MIVPNNDSIFPSHQVWLSRWTRIPNPDLAVQNGNWSEKTQWSANFNLCIYWRLASFYFFESPPVFVILILLCYFSCESNTDRDHNNNHAFFKKVHFLIFLLSSDSNLILSCCARPRPRETKRDSQFTNFLFHNPRESLFPVPVSPDTHSRLH